MEPKDYYYNQFRTDFESFWQKVHHRPNYVTGEPLFKFAGLVKGDNPDPVHHQIDSLKDISQENLAFFLSALGCSILIDQVMYTHFKEDYSTFQKKTLYPKMWVGWTNANPWMVFHQNVRLPRGLHKGEAIEKFSEFADFFVQDLKGFFETQKFSSANWTKVKEVMLNDKDVCDGDFGKIFCDKLNI